MSDDQVICPKCQKRYRWRDDFSGKTLRCPCGFDMHTNDPTCDNGDELTNVTSEPSAAPATNVYAAAMGGGTSTVAKALEQRRI